MQFVSTDDHAVAFAVRMRLTGLVKFNGVSWAPQVYEVEKRFFCAAECLTT